MFRLPVLLTGGAGFIGSHVAEALLATGRYEVFCIDNFDDFYDPGIKLKNIETLTGDPHFHLVHMDISVVTPEELLLRFSKQPFHAVIHLAARAGVRPSIEHAELYYETNVKGTLHLLEFVKQAAIPHFVFASSSSIYGNNPNLPWKESDILHQPVSPYAATKLAAEELIQVYADLHRFRYTILRLFTVYGPRQRPDLAVHRFYELIDRGLPLTLFGDGQTKRDYTYVSDTVSGIVAALERPGNDHCILNLGNHQQVSLLEMVRTLEDSMNKKAEIDWKPEQPGDVEQTFADISLAQALLGYHPVTSFGDGVQRFVEWKRKNQLANGAVKFASNVQS